MDIARIDSMDKMPHNPDIENISNVDKIHSNPCYESSKGVRTDSISGRLDDRCCSGLVVMDPAMRREQDHGYAAVDGPGEDIQQGSVSTLALDSMVGFRSELSARRAGTAADQESPAIDQVWHSGSTKAS